MIFYPLFLTAHTLVHIPNMTNEPMNQDTPSHDSALSKDITKNTGSEKDTLIKDASIKEPPKKQSFSNLMIEMIV